jgi:predicted dehydrogenase
MTGKVVKDIVRSGEIGDVLSIENDHWRGGWTDNTPQGAYRTKRRTSGIMKMEGIHQVDFFRYIAGEMTALQSFAAPNALPHYEFPDNLTVMFWFASGARGRYTINHTRSAMSLGQDWQKAPQAGHLMFWGITGTKGSMMIDVWQSQIRVFRYVANPPGSNSLQAELDRVIDYSARPDRQALFHDMSGYRYDFLERMVRGDAPLQGLEDSIITERIAHLADQSAYDGGVKIDLP